MSELIHDFEASLFRYMAGAGNPTSGSQEEKEIFAHLQTNFVAQFENAFPDRLAGKTVVIIPSLTLDQEILQKIEGVNYYEERMLCLLLLLRMPRTHVVFITSVPIDPVVVDYYLHLLPGITGYHARQRLHLLSCFDSSPVSLTEKILARPRLMQRIRQSIPNGHLAHMACFNVTELERTLAVRLHLPVYGCDPDLFHLGNKSNSRKIFAACGLNVPAGFEDLHTEAEIADALMRLKQDKPGLRRAVIKINDGFSGEGNAVFNYEGVNHDATTTAELQIGMRVRTTPVAQDLTYSAFMNKFHQMGGIVEEFIEGERKESPSVQLRINPLGKCDVVSTHDQVLGGEGGQVFLGAHFPAHTEYAGELGVMGRKVGDALRQHGVLGRFGIDFISVQEGDQWKHYAIEINLRKGGTTHPFLMLTFLTDGLYDAETGVYNTANGQKRYYFCSDNLREDCFKGLTPHDLIDIAMVHNLQYDGADQQGVMFHLIGALSQYGKLGVVCIGNTPDQASTYYRRTCEVLLNECRS
jgi:hypothetical protein